jgi:hypothetical protein
MANTVFPTFQTQYILDFSSASRSGTLGLPNTEIFPSKDVASDFSIVTRCGTLRFEKHDMFVYSKDVAARIFVVAILSFSET